MSGDGGVIEIQATTEDKPVDWNDFMALKILADQGIQRLIELQNSAIEHGVAVG